MESILSTNLLTKTYGNKKVVDSVCLSIYPGEIYGFLGPNGAGKTTTLRMILGLVRPTSGQILMAGQNVMRLPRTFMQNIGYMVEGPGFYPHLSARENLQIIQRLKKLPCNDKQIKMVLDLLGLSSAGKKPLRNYSMGMKQRLALAMALIGDPRILILDEPTNGLDPDGFLELRKLLQNLSQQKGVTILLSSHLLYEVEQLASRVGIIREGCLLTESSVNELRQKGDRKLELVVSSPKSALELIQRHTSLQAVLNEDEKILITSKEHLDAPLISSLLVNHNISLYEMRQKEMSLEEVFIELTGGNNQCLTPCSPKN